MSGEHDYLRNSYRSDYHYHELTLAKAPGTTLTLNSTEATGAMSWSFIVLLVIDDVVLLFLMQIKNYDNS